MNETKLQNDTLNIYDLEEEINNTIKVSGIPSVWEYIYIDPQIEKVTNLWDNYVNFTFQDEEKQSKNTTQHVLDTTICKQTQIT